jgi:hypothetical protein
MVVDLRIIGHPRDVESSRYCDQYGITEKEHDSSAVIIYDNALHSLLYSRLIKGLPFLIIDGYDYQPQNKNADNFLFLLRSSGLMSDVDSIFKIVRQMMCKSDANRLIYFRDMADKILTYVNSLPDLIDIHPVPNV